MIEKLICVVIIAMLFLMMVGALKDVYGIVGGMM